MTTSTEKTTSPMIYAAMLAVMHEIPAIGKDRKNVQQGYNFRGVDDVYNIVQPLFAKHGIVMTSRVLSESHEDRESRSGGTLTYCRLHLRYHFIAIDGSEIVTEVVGWGMDSSDKAANKAMAVGHKYAILQAFCIPTDDLKDPENDSPEPAPKTKPAATKPSPTAPAAPASAEGDDEFWEQANIPDKFYALNKFAAAKKELGPDAYYETLAKFKAEHANEIKPENRDMVLSVMRDLARQKKGAAK